MKLNSSARFLTPNIALGDMKQTHTNIHTDTPTVFANALKNTYTSVNVSCVSNGVWRASKMLLCCSVSDSCCLVMAALLTETTLGQLSSLFLLSASVPSVCSHCRMCLCLTCCLLLSLLWYSPFAPVSLLLPLRSVLPPSAELREGWYSNECVALLSISFLPLNCHLCLCLCCFMCRSEVFKTCLYSLVLWDTLYPGIPRFSCTFLFLSLCVCGCVCCEYLLWFRP